MKRKRHVLRSLYLTEVSAVDHPAQEGAGSILRKQHMSNEDDLATMLSEAERVSKGAPPAVTRSQAEAAMLALAKREARDGEGTCNAYARLCESDSRMQKLYALGQAADVAEEREALRKVAPYDRFTPMLLDLARMRKRSGETIEQCASRLLQTDRTVMDAYAAANGY